MAHETLTHEQARFFRAQGYFRLPDVFNDEETADLQQFVRTLAAAQPTDSYGADNPNKKLYRLYDRDPFIMGRVIRKQKLVGALSALLGPHIVFVKNRHNHATINSTVGVPAEGMHRDILQPTRGLLTAAVYLQDSTAENGATRLIPGSHDLPYVGAPQPHGGGTWMAEHSEYAGLEDQAISVPMQAGGVLLFNGLLFHGVGENLTGEERMSMTLGFRSVDELDAQPDAARQVLVAGEYIYRGNDLA